MYIIKILVVSRMISYDIFKHTDDVIPSSSVFISLRLFRSPFPISSII